jgi:hypothetical protein
MRNDSPCSQCQVHEVGARMRQRNIPKVACSQHFALTCIKLPHVATRSAATANKALN